MRIFVASGIFHPESGGPATYLYHILPEFLAHGHHVTVLSYGNDPVDGYPYPLTRVPRNNYFLRQWAYRQAARRLWSTHDIAFVHSIGLPLPSNAHPRIGKIVGDNAWERAMNRGWIPSNTDIDDFQKNSYSLLAEMNKRWRNQVVRKFDHIIVPSAYLKRMVVGWGVPQERITVIYNAPEGRQVSLHVSQKAAREELDLPDCPIFLTPARLTAWKGVDHTLKVLSAIPDAYLLVAGDGPELARLQSMAVKHGLGNRVKFLGRVPRDRLALYYRSADYTLLYSGYEGLSHVLLESLLKGTPVIASDKGGNPEVVQHQVNGLLVPYDDLNALEATLQYAAESSTRDSLAKNHMVGLERFDSERMVEQTLEVLSNYL